MTEPAAPMRRTRPTILDWTLAALAAFGALGALGACGGGDGARDGDSSNGTVASSPAAVAAGSADEQLADVTEYRLSMDKIDRYYAAQRGIMRKMQAMSPAERAAAETRNEGRSNANASLDDMVRNIESEPAFDAAVREAGLSAREFTVLTMAMMQAAMAAGIQKMRPNDDPDSLARAMKANPANVAFFREHEAELARRQEAFAAEMKRIMPADEP